MSRLSLRSRVWLGVVLVLVGLGVASLFQPFAPPGPGLGLPRFDLQAHRGGRGLWPENTLPAFLESLALGVTTLELDVGMTADGHLVVHHDRRLNPDRTRGPDGTWIAAPGPLLKELTLSALGAYDVGRADPDSEAAKRFPDQQPLDAVPVPTLERVVVAAEARSGGTARYNVETKVSPLAARETATPEAMADALLDLLARHGIATRTTVQSFDWRTLRRVQASAPEVRTVYLTAEQDWLDNLGRGQDGASPWTAGVDVDDYAASPPRAIKAAGGAVWSPFFRDLRAPDLREARRLGLKVVVWTVNEPDDMASLIDFGVDGIITDYPDRLRRVMANKGLPLPNPHPPASGP